MNTTIKWIKWVSLYALAVSFLIGCSTTTPLRQTKTFDLPSYDNGFSVKEVETAIEKAAYYRGWELKKEEPGMFVGELKIRSHYVKVHFIYNTKKLKAVYVDSRDLRYDGTVIHKKYHIWIDSFFRRVKLALSEGT